MATITRPRRGGLAAIQREMRPAPAMATRSRIGRRGAVPVEGAGRRRHQDQERINRLTPIDHSQALPRLWHAQAELMDNPLDITAWCALAEQLAPFDAMASRRAFAELGRSAAEEGYFAFALWVIKYLSKADATTAQTLLAELAKAYGQGSPRLDAHATVRPPGKPGGPEHKPAPGADNPAELPQAGDSPTGEPSPETVKIVEAARHAAVFAAAEARRRRGERPLPPQPLFSSLGKDAFCSLGNAFEVRIVDRNEEITKEGAAGSDLFVVARGAVHVERQGATVAVLRAGSFFGELALLGDARRSATVLADGEAALLVLSRQSLERVAHAHPEVADVAAAYCRERLLGRTFATSPLFLALSPADRTTAMAKFEMRTLEPGHLLAREGESNDGLFVILYGHARVEKREGSDRLHLADLGPGETVGEIGLVRGTPAGATVTASTRIVALFLSEAAFEAMAKTHPALVGAAFAVATDRERHNEAAESGAATAAEDYVL